jgi:hypothetical protein
VAKHICPPFCHRCPALYGDILPHCMGLINLPDDLILCTCRGLTCADCGQPAEVRCTWPVDVMVPVLAHDLRHGDVCGYLLQPEDPLGQIQEIKVVENVPNPRLLNFKVARHSHGRSTGRTDEYTWDLSARLLVRRQAACGLPACYRHIRDLGGEFPLSQDKFICSDHWGAQLAMIA